MDKIIRNKSISKVFSTNCQLLACKVMARWWATDEQPMRKWYEKLRIPPRNICTAKDFIDYHNFFCLLSVLPAANTIWHCFCLRLADCCLINSYLHKRGCHRILRCYGWVVVVFFATWLSGSLQVVCYMRTVSAPWRLRGFCPLFFRGYSM